MASEDPHPHPMSYVQAIAVVQEVAEQAAEVAAALRALREPEAANAVAQLAEDAARAAKVLGGLFEPEPRETERYRFHRELWVRYGDPEHLEAMTEHVTGTVDLTAAGQTAIGRATQVPRPDQDPPESDPPGQPPPASAR